MPFTSPPVERAHELLPAGTPTPSGRNDLPARPRASVLPRAAGLQRVTSGSPGADGPTLGIDRPAVHSAPAPRDGWAAAAPGAEMGFRAWPTPIRLPCPR